MHVCVSACACVCVCDRYKVELISRAVHMKRKGARKSRGLWAWNSVLHICALQMPMGVGLPGTGWLLGCKWWPDWGSSSEEEVMGPCAYWEDGVIAGWGQEEGWEQVAALCQAFPRPLSPCTA
jgi:hypothetical protein